MDEVGIDVGGTFTDFIFESNSRYTVAKVPTTQLNSSDAIIQGLGSLLIPLKGKEILAGKDDLLSGKTRYLKVSGRSIDGVTAGQRR